MRCVRALALLFCACGASPAETYLVLPFFNISADPNLEWIGESLAETVREALASEGVIALDREVREEAFRRLSVRQRTPLTRATVLRLGEVVDAGSIVYGRYEFLPPPDGVVKVKGTIRIVAQILYLRKAARGPEYNEFGALEDLARLQTHLAWQVIQAVNPEAAPSEEEFRARRPAVRVEAVENYTRGLLATSPDVRLKYLLQAVRIDPDYSQANFELGRTWFTRREWKAAADQFRRVQQWDPRYREAWFYMGLCRYRLSDFAGAETAFRSVAEHVPLNEVWNNLGVVQFRLNRPEAIETLRKALEGDPRDPDYHFNLGLALFRSGENEKAAESFRAVLDRTPDDAEAIAMLGRALQQERTPSVRRSTTPLPGERVKESYEESVWLQLKAVLQRRE